jgi:pantoate--beta-alanine ligase
MTKVIKKVKDFIKLRDGNLFLNKSVGFVPTMGALHEGHIALIKKSLKQNDITIVSIFVNPTQFNNLEDLNNYPKTFDKDLQILKKLNVDYLFNPIYSEIYSDGYKYRIIETDFSKHLCGKFRPGHFEGVLTIVMKLLNIVKPDKAYFGEKDYQQLQLVKGMVKAFFINTKIISHPTVRTKEGLALSSRNLRLNEEQLKVAAEFPRLLKSGLSIKKIKSQLKKLGFEVEYIEKFGDRIFGAVYLENIRLIDNVKV